MYTWLLTNQSQLRSQDCGLCMRRRNCLFIKIGLSYLILVRNAIQFISALCVLNDLNVCGMHLPFYGPTHTETLEEIVSKLLSPENDED